MRRIGIIAALGMLALPAAAEEQTNVTPSEVRMLNCTLATMRLEDQLREERAMVARLMAELKVAKAPIPPVEAEKPQ